MPTIFKKFIQILCLWSWLGKIGKLAFKTGSYSWRTKNFLLKNDKFKMIRKHLRVAFWASFCTRRQNQRNKIFSKTDTFIPLSLMLKFFYFSAEFFYKLQKKLRSAKHGRTRSLYDPVAIDNARALPAKPF